MPEPTTPELHDSAPPNATAGENTGGRVFISYASEDVAVADTLCAAIEAAGVACWIAPRDVRPGEPYAAEIVQAINSCGMLVLVLSKSAVDSPHVLREVERAASKKRPVLSIRMDSTELPPQLEYFLSSDHWLDASAGPVARIVPALIAAVRARTGAARPTAAITRGLDGAHGAQRAGAKRMFIIVGAVIGLALAFWVAQKYWPNKSIRQTTEAAATTPNAAAFVNDKSIAVLPFTDMSEKRDQEYFSDGMAEEIIDLLVKIPELKVPARTSSFYFKGKSTQIPEIARQLGVTHVLEGSVRKSGNHLRVTAQLVRADNGYHLWSETYDRQIDDVFKMQDEIAEAVVKALKVSLLQRDVRNAAPTSSTEAYQLYLQARALLNRSPDETVKAYRNLQQAVQLDPKFALAWADLAEVLTKDNVPWYQVFAPPGAHVHSEDNLQDWAFVWGQARSAAHAAAAQALTLAPDLAEAHAAKAGVLAWIDWDWAAADAELKKARELAPENAHIAVSAADITINLGRIAEGIQIATAASAQDPLGPAIRKIAWAQYVGGTLQEAEVSERKAIDLFPADTATYFHYGLVLLAQGKPQAALEQMEQEHSAPFRNVGLPLALDALGRHSDADRAIAAAEKMYGNGMAYQIAYVYAARKDADRTFHWLDRAYQQHDGGLGEMKVDPMFKGLTHDPRFNELLRKVGLPE